MPDDRDVAVCFKSLFQSDKCSEYWDVIKDAYVNTCGGDSVVAKKPGEVINESTKRLCAAIKARDAAKKKVAEVAPLIRKLLQQMQQLSQSLPKLEEELKAAEIELKEARVENETTMLQIEAGTQLAASGIDDNDKAEFEKLQVQIQQLQAKLIELCSRRATAKASEAESACPSGPAKDAGSVPVHDADELMAEAVGKRTEEPSSHEGAPLKKRKEEQSQASGAVATQPDQAQASGSAATQLDEPKDAPLDPHLAVEEARKLAESVGAMAAASEPPQQG